jgi:hypothetical protein
MPSYATCVLECGEDALAGIAKMSRDVALVLEGLSLELFLDP